ncbi:MAG: Dps family protein [Rhodospirillaceae bacterium]
MSITVLNPKADVVETKTGIAPTDQTRLANGLSGLLSDTYTLMIKTHGYHWNVVGPMFRTVHLMTEEHYEDLFQAADDLAERIRSLGHPAPASFTDMAALTVIEEEKGSPTAQQIIETLVDDHEKIVRRLRETAEIAGDLKDSVTADMLTERMQFHEKAVWMLRSTLAE